VYSDNLIDIANNIGADTCTRETCVPPTNGTYFSIIDIFMHLAFRMDHFISELYALSNCIKNCNLTPQPTPTSCVVDGNNMASIQYCNNKLYGTNADPSVATNEFKPYMKDPIANRLINLNNMPKYKRSGSTTIDITKSTINAKYTIKTNIYFDLNNQYTYIKNLTNTFNDLLTKYAINNNFSDDVIKSKYTELLNKRAEMDATLEEIFGKNNTINMDSMQYYDSTIYTSIFWTVLVTSLLFYTFRKL
jgi:hypothetical protein